METIDVSIIILTKNAGSNFKPLLERLFSQEFNGEYEVLVIDSGSTDDTLNTAKQFPVRITQIKPEEFHHGKTRNLGAQLSLGSALVYITQDALPLNNQWLQKLVEISRSQMLPGSVADKSPGRPPNPPRNSSMSTISLSTRSRSPSELRTITTTISLYPMSTQP